jgi:hypothetical protein
MNEWPPLPPNRDELHGEELSYYDEVAERQRRLWGMEPQGYFGAMLNSPRLAAAVSELGRRVRTSAKEGVTPDARRETADMVLCVELDNDAVFTVHLPDAVAVGVRPQMIAGLVSGDESEFTAEERLLVDHVRAVLNGTVTAESFNALAAQITVRGAVEFTLITTFLISTMRAMAALGTATVPGSPVDRAALVQPYLDGTAALPDPNAHTG